jgi:hypothetical protein
MNFRLHKRILLVGALLYAKAVHEDVMYTESAPGDLAKGRIH